MESLKILINKMKHPDECGSGCFYFSQGSISTCEYHECYKIGGRIDGEIINGFPKDCPIKESCNDKCK